MSEQVKLKQSLDVNYMNLLYEDDSVSIVECLVLHEGVNRNKSNLPHDVVVAALPSLANKPIWAIPDATIFKSDATDFTEHARTDNDENNIMIFGTFPESGVNAAEFVDIDDKTYLKVQAVLWKQYAPIAMSILNNRDGKAKISIEILVKGTQDDDGILNVTEMQFLSATVLGAKIPEGIEGSSLQIVRYSLDETISESKTHYQTYSQKYKINKDIKNIVTEGLKLKEKLGNNGESSSYVMANYLLKNDYVSDSQYKVLKNYFENNSKTDINKINWMLYGGDATLKWIKGVNGLTKDNKLEFVSKDELGSKDKIVIDKSKDSLSDGAWSDDGLRAACLEASNWKTVCKAVFLKREDGWEDGKEGSLGYPVMEKTGDKVVYNRKGLASAKGYAEKNGETAVLTSLKAIYKHLDLSWDEDNSKETDSKKEDETLKNKAINKFSLTSSQIYDILGNAFSQYKYKDGDYECHKYWVNDYDDSFVYVYDCEEGKDYGFSYSIKNDIATIDENSKKEVIGGGWQFVDQVKTNASDAVVPDDSANDVDTGNCVDADLDDYKAKFEALSKECDTIKNELAGYKAKEKKEADEKKMSELLNSFAHCYSEDELAKAKESMKDSTVEDFEKSVNEQIKSFALKMKDKMSEDDKSADKKDDKDKEDKKPDENKKDDKNKEVKKNSFGYSVSPFGACPTYNFSKSDKEENVDCATKYGVKF